MNTSRDEQLFADALAVPAGERSAWLEQACGDDAARRDRLEALLRAHDEAHSFMAAPAPEAPVAAGSSAFPAEEKAGDRIGRYKLLQKIGEGGCGVVYMAEQEESVRRRVALKIIKLGMDTRAVIARFEAERQALARMEHPNIARVLDAGATAAGRPFFVMELVRGVRITEYCDQNNLSTEQRLELFMKVCQAIQHAHQKGIIHRDIKPSNILVTLHDGQPVPKVIDFGIAKATHGRLTDQTLFTAFEQFIGTPAYVSPEQAEMSSLDIDTRSDIYSLGVLLYELLTGRTPFNTQELTQAGIDGMRRLIREQQPPRPSHRLRTLADSDRTTIAQRRGTDGPRLVLRLRGDLDWIVMRCLEKDRARRYETANGLAMDIQRHLDNEPVTARPPSTAYLLQKLVRRHRLGFLAGAAVVVTLVAGLGVSTSLFLSERQMLARARLAEQERAKALRTAIEQKSAAERARINEARLRQQAEFDEQKARSEAVRREQIAAFTAEIVKDIGELVASNGDPRPVLQVLNHATARLQKEGQAQPDLLEVLGVVYSKIGQLERAEAMMRRTLELRRGRPAASRREEVQTLNFLGVVLNAQDKLDEAEDCLREALGILQRDPDPAARHVLAQSQANLGWVLGRQGRFGEAEDMIGAALKHQTEQFGLEHIDVATSLRRLGAVYMQEGRLDMAEETLREALRLTRKTLGNDHLEVVSSLNFLAITLGMQLAQQPAKIRDALELYRESKAIRQRLQNPGVALPQPESLAAALEQPGSSAEVETALKEMRRIARAQFPAGSWEDAFFLAFTAYVQIAEKKWTEAEATARECHAIRQGLRPEDWSTFHAQHLIGAALVGQRKFIEGEPLLVDGYQGMKAREALIPPFHLVHLGEALRRIVNCYADWGKPALAAKWRAELDRTTAALKRKD